MIRNDNKALMGGGSFFAASVIAFLMTLVYSLFAYIFGDGTAYKVASYITGIVTQLLFIIVVYVFSKKTGGRPDYLEMKRPNARGIILGIGTAVIGLLGFYLISLLFSYGLEGIGYSVPGISLDTPLDWTFSIIRVLIFAPVCEEVLFRGGVLTGTNSLMSGRRFGKAGSVILCGAMFMLLHMNPSQTAYQFLFGCLLAMLTMSAGSIVPAIIAHAANNAAALILELPFADGMGGALHSFFTSLPALFVILAAVLAAGAFTGARFLYKKLSKNANAGRKAEKTVDGGARLMGIVLFVFGAVICIFMWVWMLISGMGAAA